MPFTPSHLVASSQLPTRLQERQTRSAPVHRLTTTKAEWRATPPSCLSWGRLWERRSPLPQKIAMFSPPRAHSPVRAGSASIDRFQGLSSSWRDQRWGAQSNRKSIGQVVKPRPALAPDVSTLLCLLLTVVVGGANKGSPPA